MSDRGGPHAVIYKYGEPFFDPYPDRSFIVNPYAVMFIRNRINYIVKEEK